MTKNGQYFSVFFLILKKSDVRLAIGESSQNDLLERVSLRRNCH